MRKPALKLACLLACIVLLGCTGTEIEKNPKPVVWGELTFAPATIERGKSKTVWNNVAVSGYGHKGVIGKVIITEDQTVVEDLRSDIFSAKRQVFKNVSGEYREALQFLLSASLTREGKKPGALPKFSIAVYEIEDGQWQNEELTNRIAKGKGRNCSFTTLSDWEAANIAAKFRDGPEVQIASASIKQIVIPDDTESHPENLVFENVEFKDISVPEEKAKVERLFVDYKNFALKLAVDNAVIPGNALADLMLREVPETLQGSLKGEGKITGGLYEADAALDLKGLLDLQADVKGSVLAQIPQAVSFELRDRGLLKYISNEEKAQIVMLTMFLPGAQEPVMNFLTNPGQTLEGSVVFENGRPVISLKTK